MYLYLGSLVADDAGHRGEGGELVGRHLRVHARQVTEQGGLPHRGEAHKPDTGITRFGHIETWRNRPGMRKNVHEELESLNVETQQPSSEL